jgi:hypothetical protein
MDCLKIDILNYDANYLYPIMGFTGLCMTYLGNKFVRPTIFSLGTILSMESSYKATHLILNHFEYTKNECLIKNVVSIISGLSGGFLLLKLYRLTNFFLGFLLGGSSGYLSYNLINNHHLEKIEIYNTDTLLSIIIPGISLGMIAVYNEHRISILTTSFIGPALLLWSFNEFTHYYNLYIFMLTYISLSSSGFYIQYRKYKNDKIKDTIKSDFDITYNGKK